MFSGVAQEVGRERRAVIPLSAPESTSSNGASA